ncbi:hypothetical protein ACOSP7_015040 [Xanthoceras sorbifolium]
MRAPLWDQLRVKVQKQEEHEMSVKGSYGIIKSSLVGIGDGLKIKEGSATITAIRGIPVPTQEMVMGEKEKDSRLRPGPGACGVGLKGLGERGSIESGSSVGLGVEAQGGNYGGEGVNLGVKSVTSLGHGVGAQSVDMGSFYEKETRIVLSSSGPEFMKMVDMEGVELDVGDALVCVDTIDGPSGVQMVKKIDPKEKSTSKWKRAAQA